jgi:hypothetical protein
VADRVDASVDHVETAGGHADSNRLLGETRH